MSDEQKKLAWDLTRACFYLLAGIVWAQIILAYGVWAACEFDGVPGSCRDLAPNIMDLLTGGLAVVLAFSGRMK